MLIRDNALVSYHSDSLEWVWFILGSAQVTARVSTEILPSKIAEIVLIKWKKREVLKNDTFWPSTHICIRTVVNLLCLLCHYDVFLNCRVINPTGMPQRHTTNASNKSSDATHSKWCLGHFPALLQLAKLRIFLSSKKSQDVFKNNYVSTQLHREGDGTDVWSNSKFLH